MKKLKVSNFSSYYNLCGTITYSGFINNELVRLLSYDRLKTSVAKERLIARYEREHQNEIVCEK